MRGRLDRRAGIEPDMARQAVHVETRLRHAAGDDRADVFALGAGALQHLAADLDAEIGRRDRGERAVIVGERRAHALDQPGVGEGCADARVSSRSCQAFLSMVMTRADGGSEYISSTSALRCVSTARWLIEPLSVISPTSSEGGLGEFSSPGPLGGSMRPAAPCRVWGSAVVE